ncbi:substrate-binding periplasmic protein [Rhodococcus koreensis]
MTVLRLICVNLESAPLFTKETPSAPRVGYEVEVAAAVASHAQHEVQWVFRPWAEMIPALRDGHGDAILCGQGITDERATMVDFTRPYAVFDEAVLVRAGDGITSPENLRGKRVLAIDGSTNMSLAQTFTGSEVIPFAATGEDVLGDLVAALRRHEVDAVVDDEVVLQPLLNSGDLEVAFSVPTQNRWGIALAPGNTEMRELLDSALSSAIAAGDLERAWKQWMPTLDYPPLGELS